MRLRSWCVLMTALFTATTAMADASYPARTGGNYSGPRWYGYYANSTKNGTSYVPLNFDHTNITEIWATQIGETPRSSQLTDAEKRITTQLAIAKQYGIKAMVDVGAFVFIPDSPTGNCTNVCYDNNPSAGGQTGDFQTLVTILINDGYLIPNHPELSTVSSFYVADEPDINGLADASSDPLQPLPFPPNPALLNAISAIRNNPNTTNFPLATIVTKNGYSDMPSGLGLFDWISFDDYGSGYLTYLQTLAGFKVITHNNDVVGGTPQHYFMVPAVTWGLGAGHAFVGGAPSFYQEFVNDPSIIGIMPFKWSDATDSNGMNANSSWAPEYIALGKSIIPPPTGSVTLSPRVSSSGSFALNWAQDATATYYQVYQSAAGGGAPFTSINVSTNSYTATNLANGTYTFYVQDCDASSCTPATGQTGNGTVNISAPVSLSLSPATSRSGSFTLSWASSWTGSYPFQQYRIFQSFNGGNWTWAATVNTTTSYVFTDLATGSYAYYVVACNQGSDGWSDCSGASGQATETVALSAPNGLTFSPSGTSTNGSFTLSWNSTWNGPYTFEQYHIYQSSNGGASWTWVYTINNTTSKAISGLGDGTYTYKIQACNTAACGSFSSTASETVSTGGGGIGGGGGGCPPQPLQCQLVMPDDYAASRGD